MASELKLPASRRSYLEALEKLNKPKKYYEYSSETRSEVDGKAAKAKADVYDALGSYSMRYGKISEAEAGKGLLGSGYERFLSAKAKENAKGAIADIESERIADGKRLYSSYQSYLNSYENRQKSIKQGLIDKLSNSNIINPVSIYEHALESGLSKESAEETIGAVTAAVKMKLRATIIEKMYEKQITAKTVANYVRSLGFDEATISELYLMAKDIEENQNEFSTNYLEYLESLGNQNTVSHKSD